MNQEIEEPIEAPQDSDGEDTFIFRLSPATGLVVLRALLWLGLLALVFLGRQAILPTPAPNWADDAWLPKLMTVLACGIGLVGATDIVVLLIWRATTNYAMTHHELLVERGIIHRSGKTIALQAIDGIEYHRGFFGWLGGFGSIEIIVNKNEEPIVLEAVPSVSAVFAEIIGRRGQMNKPTTTSVQRSRNRKRTAKEGGEEAEDTR